MEAMDSWKGFCDLSQEDKDRLSGGDRLHDFGYMRRNDQGPRCDQKEVFHVVGTLIDDLRAKAEGISDKRAASFIHAIDMLLQESSSLIQTFARLVEGRYGLDGFEEEVARSQDNWTFRYLHYIGGEILAHPHTDRGGFTLHLHESDEGGEYLGLDKQWHPWPVSETETIIFPSMGLQYRSEGKLKALCHQVQSTPKTAQSGRYAMVAFIDFKQSRRYNDAAKRLQDFSPGFNYDMPFGEFETLFCSVLRLTPSLPSDGVLFIHNLEIRLKCEHVAIRKKERF